jgi:hypothetical protein
MAVFAKKSSVTEGKAVQTQQSAYIQAEIAFPNSLLSSMKVTKPQNKFT